jgi:hypothetical protein
MNTVRIQLFVGKVIRLKRLSRFVERSTSRENNQRVARVSALIHRGNGFDTGKRTVDTRTIYDERHSFGFSQSNLYSYSVCLSVCIVLVMTNDFSIGALGLL